MQPYNSRKIEFKEVIRVGEWQVKIYTIAKTGSFDQPEVYQQAIKRLPEWLKMQNHFDDQNERMAFLILHAGTEGTFAIINWWVGTNMLNTHIFLTQPETPHHFQRISGNGLSPCIWELEVINHERVAWMDHVLKQYPEPDYASYLASTFSAEI